MRVLILDKTAVLGTAHERHALLAETSGVELCVLSPTWWPEHMRDVRAERVSDPRYEIRLGATLWTGSYSRGFYVSGLGAALRNFEPDVIQLLEEPWSLFAGQTAWLAGRIVPRAKLLFYTWENIYRQGTYCSRLDPLHRRVERAVFARASAGVCATELAAQVVRKRGFHGGTPVIPYGVSKEFFLPEGELHRRVDRPPGDPFRVGYVGRLLPMKGVETLIEALPRTSARLVVVGSGPAEEGLKRLAGSLGVHERVEWIPAVATSGVPALMKSLDVLVLPSRTMPVWAEQLGRVLIEAMASGVPVVGSSSGSIPEVIGEEGLIFPEGDSAALAECLGRLEREAGLRARLIRSAWAKARGRYTWERFAADLVETWRWFLSAD